MAFIHPLPLDQSCWLYQMAHLSTWFQCVAIDVPGFGRSPKASGGLTLDELAEACWNTVDELFPDQPAILVGCSMGAVIGPRMYHRRPGRTTALVISGSGAPDETLIARVADNARNYAQDGISFRWHQTFKDFSPAFAATPLAHFFAEMLDERNGLADAESIVHDMRAVIDYVQWLATPAGRDYFSKIACPTIILSGSEDAAHPQALALQRLIPNCTLKVLPGAGHACMVEQPWLFDRYLLEFLDANRLLPAISSTRGTT